MLSDQNDLINLLKKESAEEEGPRLRRKPLAYWRMSSDERTDGSSLMVIPVGVRAEDIKTRASFIGEEKSLLWSRRRLPFVSAKIFDGGHLKIVKGFLSDDVFLIRRSFKLHLFNSFSKMMGYFLFREQPCSKRGA
jgi:hypothetical protein